MSFPRTRDFHHGLIDPWPEHIEQCLLQYRWVTAKLALDGCSPMIPQDATGARTSVTPRGIVFSRSSIVPGDSTSPCGAWTRSSCSRGTTRASRIVIVWLSLAATARYANKRAVFDQLVALPRDHDIDAATKYRNAAHASRPSWSVSIMPGTTLIKCAEMTYSDLPPSSADGKTVTAATAAGSPPQELSTVIENSPTCSQSSKIHPPLIDSNDETNAGGRCGQAVCVPVPEACGASTTAAAHRRWGSQSAPSQ